MFENTFLIIPAFNEAKTIRKVVEGSLLTVSNIIVIDDGSTDETVSILKKLPVKVVQQPQNRGKSVCLWTGFELALSLGAREIVTMDADGQHDPDDIAPMIQASHDHPHSLIIGNRLWNRSAFPLNRYFSNQFGNFWIGWTSGQALADSQSGFRVYPAPLIQQLAFKTRWEQGFVLESEILIDASDLGFKVLFVPIKTYYPKDRRPSYFRPILDLYWIVRMVAHRLWHRGLNPSGLFWSVVKKPLHAFKPPH